MQQCPAAIVAGGDRDGMIYAIQGGLQNLSFGSHPAYVLNSKMDNIERNHDILDAQTVSSSRGENNIRLILLTVSKN